MEIRILKTTEQDFAQKWSTIKKRGGVFNDDVLQSVGEILHLVKTQGDAGLRKLAKRFGDLATGEEDLLVAKNEIDLAANKASRADILALKKAYRRIKEYHQKQVTTGYTCEKEPGVLLGQKVLPLERVGIYAPGGLASYPSTILMAAIPARIAGVDEIILCSPQRSGEINPLIAYATKLCTIDKFFRVGGAQAIAALSYGTETIPQVDKIVGPGNAYVACAKKLVFGQVDIDMVAGPSEVMIIADDLAIPAYIASDMLAQAEHDERASSIIVTTSEELAVDVAGAIALQLANMDTAQIARQALSKNGLVVIVRDIAEAVAIANDFAPEHLEIMAKNPRRLLGKIRNAGSVFLGDYSPEALGDYLAGANHILPTSGTARFASPLGVYSFTKRMSFLSFSQEAFRKLASATATLAQAEGLTAHANSVRIRTQHLREKRKESV